MSHTPYTPRHGAPRPAALIVALLLLSIALVGGIASLRAQGFTLKRVPAFLKISYDEKRAWFDGPLYQLGSVASAIIPPEDTVYFFNPNGTGGYYHAKLTYQLYPRKVVGVRHDKELGAEDILKYDYVAVFLPAKSFRMEIVNSFDTSKFLKRVYHEMDAKGYQAVYRVDKQGVR